MRCLDCSHNQSVYGTPLSALPGMVDLQINGFRGVDFSDASLTAETFATAARGIIQSGCACFLATVITSSMETYRHVLPLIAAAADSDEFRGRLLGIHMEGPFISPLPGYHGAHPVKHVQVPTHELVEELVALARGKLRMVTLAAEIDGAEAATRQLVGHGVVVSVGHSAEADLSRISDAGASSITHLGNGTPPTLPRHANFVWAGMAEDRLSAGIISDGRHLPVAVLRSIIRTKGVPQCYLVSDLAPVGGGLPPGRYECFGTEVDVDAEGAVRQVGKPNLAGAGIPMLTCANRLRDLRLVTDSELASLAFFNPLRVLNYSAAQVLEVLALPRVVEFNHFAGFTATADGAPARTIKRARGGAGGERAAAKRKRE